MTVIDVHCHLYARSDAGEAVARARESGVTRVLVVSEDLETMEQTLRVRDKFPEFVLPGLGIHPVNVLSMSAAEWQRALSFLRAHAREASCVGEIGLDYKHAASEESRERQVHALEAQMEVAAEYRLPVNLHSRRALRDTMEQAIAFRKDTGLPALLHWFAHSRKLLRRTNEEGIFVSVGPSVLFSDEALHMAGAIAPHLILVETDTPVPFQGRASEPSWAADVSKRLIAGHPDLQLTEEGLIENTREYLKPVGCILSLIHI